MWRIGRRRSILNLGQSFLGNQSGERGSLHAAILAASAVGGYQASGARLSPAAVDKKDFGETKNADFNKREINIIMKRILNIIFKGVLATLE